MTLVSRENQTRPFSCCLTLQVSRSRCHPASSPSVFLFVKLSLSLSRALSPSPSAPPFSSTSLCPPVASRTHGVCLCSGGQEIWPCLVMTADSRSLVVGGLLAPDLFISQRKPYNLLYECICVCVWRIISGQKGEEIRRLINWWMSNLFFCFLNLHNKHHVEDQQTKGFFSLSSVRINWISLVPSDMFTDE